MINQGHILTSAEMRDAEEALMKAGTSVDELMLRAGTGAAEIIWRTAADKPTLVLCGPGNNGGDGYVIAEFLRQKAVPVTVAAATEPRTEAAQTAKSLWKGETRQLKDAQPQPQFIDCLFGTGLTRPVSGAFLEDYLRLSCAAARRVAVDLPSGVDSDSGALLNELPQCDLTIALGAYKPAHYLAPARNGMGQLTGVDIGVRADSNLTVIAKPDLLPPEPGSHKYRRGLVVIVAGDMPGAAQLTALAAQSAGAGYVKIFTEDGCISPRSSIVTTPYSGPPALEKLLSDERIATVVVGPGLGRGSSARTILDTVLCCDKPLLLDADALHLLGSGFAERVRHREALVIATPHAGEFATIANAVEGSKIDQTRALAAASASIIVHKGQDTLVADQQGRAAIATFSSSWLSTAGSGDALAGLVAARFAVTKDGFDAAEQGQWLHSRSAQLAGPAFAPEKLIEHIPQAIQECL